MAARLLQTLWRIVPAPVRTNFWSLFHDISVGRPAADPPGVAPGDKIVIAGMFSTASGLGAWARSNYRALKSAGFDVVAVDLSELLSSADLECDIPFSGFPPDRTGTLILHVNGPEAAYSLRKIGLMRGRSWRVIGAWAWELEVFPPGWEKAFPLLSEVWALSDFAAAAIRRHPDAPPVRVVPIAVAPPDNATVRPADPDSPYTILAMADALSMFERKNPLGAVKAFRLAFGDRSDCRLILKLRNLESLPDRGAALTSEIAGAPNIELLESSLSEDEQYAMVRSADVFLSLHRAEGFGLGPAEAMALGVPVIATNWSGNLQFMTSDTSALIPYKLVPVPEDCLHYGIEGAEWADPDIDAAAEWMRRLESDRELGREMAERARRRVMDVCGEDSVRALALGYLAEVPDRKSR